MSKIISKKKKTFTHTKRERKRERDGDTKLHDLQYNDQFMNGCEVRLKTASEKKRWRNKWATITKKREIELNFNTHATQTNKLSLE